jgi:dolichyl-phosphate-mannose-protein mannosyltransferase
VSALRAISEARIGAERTRALAPVAAAAVLLALAVFVFFFPVLTGRAISYQAWKARMWFPSWI